ncbi:MAG: N-acetyl-gamma-glutamyl-phosphate reductase [Candidatus Omnitrophica bacterium]|nr:N-acetyl-gamma-glutamyl-phosphate reductase [Candidatus Omnitrophota bacterium]
MVLTKMIQAAIFGVSGYAGQKLVEILLRHPLVKIVSGYVAPEEGKPALTEIIPKVKKVVELSCENQPDWDQIVAEADVVFLALPHAVSMKFVLPLRQKKKKVIDFSADFRFQNLKTYEAFYATHFCPQLCSEAVYGLPEINRQKIKQASLIANPGCYPTSLILGLLPLVKNNLIEPEIIVDAKSGVTGAGRTPSANLLFAECHENVKAYKIAEHRHEPEMEEILSSVGQVKYRVCFVPHLIPVNQGILSTIYVVLRQNTDQKEIQNLYEEFYAKEPFVRLMPYGQSPQTKNVVDTNFCDIGLKLVEGKRLIVVSAIDNLIKGASGQAVQNMNLMFGFPETLPFYSQES